jgi:hypothetical protein
MAESPKSKSDDSIDEKMGCVILLGILFFAIIYAIPHFEPDQFDMHDTREMRSAIVARLTSSFSTDIQLKQLGGYSLEIWISKKSFESVGYLDRKSILQSIGKDWCDKFGGWKSPTVVVRDATSGKDLATYHCTFGNTTIE